MENDERYTPYYIFQALGCRFNMDVASPIDRTHCCVPADRFITGDSLNRNWTGFVWCNPPYSGRNSKSLWLNKLHEHGNGIGLFPDRSSAPWWQEAAGKCDVLLNVSSKIKFIQPDGSILKQPENGSTLFGYGEQAVSALRQAEYNGLGICLIRINY